MEKEIAARKLLARKILDLEHKIVSWSVTNSQSNPGAVMELRAWKKLLETARADYKALVKETPTKD
jgi:hypothetical protein